MATCALRTCLLRGLAEVPIAGVRFHPPHGCYSQITTYSLRVAAAVCLTLVRVGGRANTHQMTRGSGGGGGGGDGSAAGGMMGLYGVGK